MVAKHTRKKPAKPSRGFPLTANGNGQWSKKIRGKVRYFGRWEDPQTALKKYLAEREYLDAGKKPPAVRDGLTVKELANRFLTAKKNAVLTGELTQRSLLDYIRTCGRVIDCFGAGVLVEDLTPNDFEALRAGLAKGRGIVSLGNEVRRARSLFIYAFQAALIDRPLQFGQVFRQPSKKVRRRAGNAVGPKLFTAEEIRKLLELATPPLRCMILLGINAAFGNWDCATLPESKVDLARGWHTFGREKTGAERRAPLWPETVAAFREWFKVRPTPEGRSARRACVCDQSGEPVDSTAEPGYRRLD